MDVQQHGKINRNPRNDARASEILFGVTRS
jgi:hypothetical protein